MAGLDLKKLQQDMPHGACPLPYAVQLVQGGGTIQAPGNSLATALVVAPCLGEYCQWWDGYANMCVVKNLPLLVEALLGHQAPLGGPSGPATPI